MKELIKYNFIIISLNLTKTQIVRLKLLNQEEIMKKRCVLVQVLKIKFT